MSEKHVVITKIGDISSPNPSQINKEETVNPTGGKHVRKTLKGILKVKGVSDPAKSPPLRKTAKRRRIQILTESGSKKLRRTIRRKLDRMTNKQVSELAEKHGLLKGRNTPPELTRHIVEGGITTGFISSL